MIVNIEEDPRHGLQVKRYSTWRTIQVQTVGEHSAQIMRIMLTVWPECPRHLLVHAVLHDVGEMAGDIPYPFKRNDPELKDRMHLAELRVHRNMTEKFMLPGPVRLNEREYDFFKFCEYLEMFEFGLQERNMGNKYATVVATRMLLAACTLMGKLDTVLQARARRYVAIRQEQESETEQVLPSDPSEETEVRQFKGEQNAG